MPTNAFAKHRNDLLERSFKRPWVFVGATVGVAMLKDLLATVAKEKSCIGVFITLAPPTKVMETEAVAAGFYAPPQSRGAPWRNRNATEDFP